jgi:hypothetical protein
MATEFWKLMQVSNSNIAAAGALNNINDADRVGLRSVRANRTAVIQNQGDGLVMAGVSNAAPDSLP